MADATRDRNTIKKLSSVYHPQVVLNMPAASIAYYGVMKAADANQRAVTPGGAAALKVMGVVKQRIDNSAGGNDERKVELETGVFIFDNDGDITVGDVGKTCYAADDQTVTLVGASGAEVGKIMAVHANGVEVGIGPMYHTT